MKSEFGKQQNENVMKQTLKKLKKKCFWGKQNWHSGLALNHSIQYENIYNLKPPWRPFYKLRSSSKKHIHELNIASNNQQRINIITQSYKKYGRPGITI